VAPFLLYRFVPAIEVSTNSKSGGNYDGFEKIDKAALQIPGVRRFGILCHLSLQGRVRLAINLLRPMRATIQQLRRALRSML
jgi:hypothetical protein